MNASYGETFGLGVQRYRGEEYLTFWRGDDSVGGHGEGWYYMVCSLFNWPQKTNEKIRQRLIHSLSTARLELQ